MNKLHFVVFLTIALSVFFGIHYFVFTRVANGLALSGIGRYALRLFFIAAALSFVATEFLTHRGAPSWAKPAADFGYIWLGLISMAFAAFLCLEIIRIVFPGDAFRYYSTVSALLVVGLAAAYSIYNVASGPIVRELTIRTQKLPENVKQFTIVQLSDMHVDMLTKPAWLENIISRTNSFDPDLILITGDLIDSDICARPGICLTLKGLKSRYGVYAVSGNHEFYTGMDKFISTSQNAGFTIIDGKKTEAAGFIELVGISDQVSAKGVKAFDEIKSILSASPQYNPEEFSVLLSHRPDTFDAAAKLGIDLQLSGHTHAGQIPPMDLIVMLAYKYPCGFYRNGNSCVYTTTGTGIWGPPMRLFTRSEIVKIVLER